MSTRNDRDRIKRLIGYDAFPQENNLSRAWSVKHYIHVDGKKFPVTDLGDRFCVRIALLHVYGDTLEQARERLLDLLEGIGD